MATQNQRLQRTEKSDCSSHRESELLSKINQQLPAKRQTRFDELVAKRRDETLSAEEHEELLRLIEQVEAGDAARIEALTELAQLRGLSVDQLMDQLGIKRPEIV